MARSSRTAGPADAVVQIVGDDGKAARALAVVAISADGSDPALASTMLASNVTLNANAGTPAVAGVKRGVYVWDAQWTGSGTLALQSLGADGITYRDVATLAGPGTFAGEIRIGANATLRLFNKNANGGAAFTGLYSSIS